MSPRDRILKRLATTTEGTHAVGELSDDLSIPIANVRRVIAGLVDDGLVVALGESGSGARCYGIVGRAEATAEHETTEMPETAQSSTPAIPTDWHIARSGCGDSGESLWTIGGKWLLTNDHTMPAEVWNVIVALIAARDAAATNAEESK